MMATLQTPYLLRACCTRSLLRRFSHKTCLRQFSLKLRKTASKQMREFSVGPIAKANCETVADFGLEDGPANHASDIQKALEAAMSDSCSSFRKGSVTRLGSAGGAIVATFPSGCLTLDYALGGGLPIGRIVEIYGPESSGKTT